MQCACHGTITGIAARTGANPALARRCRPGLVRSRPDRTSSVRHSGAGDGRRFLHRPNTVSNLGGSAAMESRPPLPPFTLETARRKARAAEDGWNSRDPVRVSLAYTPDSAWRNRAEFFSGREAIVAFLERKWARELDYRLIKEVWACTENRIAVRFAYEWHDDSGSWFRSYGNENWEFDEHGLMRKRYASINDLPIRESDRKYRWPLGRRPDDHPGLSELGL
jgi:nuclear transport factor 2 (NTF2) superfamily protein